MRLAAMFEYFCIIVTHNPLRPRMSHNFGARVFSVVKILQVRGEMSEDFILRENLPFEEKSEKIEIVRLI